MVVETSPLGLEPEIMIAPDGSKVLSKQQNRKIDNMGRRRSTRDERRTMVKTFVF